MDIEREGEGDGAEEATLQHALKITKLASVRNPTHPHPQQGKSGVKGFSFKCIFSF